MHGCDYPVDWWLIKLIIILSISFNQNQTCPTKKWEHAAPTKIVIPLKLLQELHIPFVCVSLPLTAPPLQLPVASQRLSAAQFREGWWSPVCVKSHRYKCLATRATWEVYQCCWVRTAGGRRWRKRGTTPLQSWRPPSSWSCSGCCREGAWPPLCICRTTTGRR